MNGDILTTLDYGALVAHHRESGAALTIAVQGKRVDIDLGVLELDGDRVTGYREKPTLSYDVSMGVYVYEARALEHLPDGPCQFPELCSGCSTRASTSAPSAPTSLVRPRDDQRVRARRGGAGAPRKRAGVTRALITGDHRPGRLVPRRAAAGARLRGARPGAGASSQRRTSTHVATGSRSTRATCATRTRWPRALARGPPGRGLQPRRRLVGRGLVEGPGAHRRGHRPRRGAAARGGARRRARRRGCLPGVVERDLRPAREPPQTRQTPLRPAHAVRRRQGLRPPPRGRATARRTACSAATASSSTTRARGAACEFVTRKITHGAAAIKLGAGGRAAARERSMRSATGATRRTTSRRCG